MCRLQFSSLRVFQWNADGLPQVKKHELVKNLATYDIDVLTVMESNLDLEKLKYFTFKGYSLFLPPKSRQVASGILTGVKESLTARFKIFIDMCHDSDISEVTYLEAQLSL
ncbi:hypothetical protein TNCV_4892731 [Trichonephila clavipes]|nr:hypothetical protein TNCV_4892731 [Trichonephila clavipes]